MRLYSFSHSSSAWRVRIGLALKGVDYEYVAVNIGRDANEQDRPGYERHNPLRQIPVLEWEDKGATRRLTQSVAILEWLDRAHPDPPLVPADPLAAAHVREMVEVVNAGTQPFQNNRVLADVARLGGDENQWAHQWIAKGLAALEILARERAQRFLAGNDVTLADVFLVPQLYNARRYRVDLDSVSTLVRVESECARHPAFVAAHPDRQPDAPSADGSSL